MRLFDKNNVITYYHDRDHENAEIELGRLPGMEVIEEGRRAEIIQITFPNSNLKYKKSEIVFKDQFPQKTNKNRKKYKTLEEKKEIDTDEHDNSNYMFTTYMSDQSVCTTKIHDFRSYKADDSQDPSLNETCETDNSMLPEDLFKD
jgi:hypothetical protein